MWTKYKEEKFKLAEFGERNKKGMHDETGGILEIGNFQIESATKSQSFG